MSKTMKIGIFQQKSLLGNVKINMKSVVEKVDELCKNDLDIVCLPELFATGYNLELLGGEKTIELIKENYNFIISTLSDICKKNSIYLIAPCGMPDENNEGVYNTAIVFNDKGEIVGNYSKNHLWDLESKYFNRGEDINVYNTKFGNFGIMICYDAGFPEVARKLMLKGADVIFIPAAWRIQDEDMWDLNLSQRALENVLFTVGVNLVSEDSNLILFGKSKVCNPRGTIIHQLDKYKESSMIVEIDLDEIKKYREEIPYIKDRKDMYDI